MTANALQKNVKKQLFRFGQMAKENFGSVSIANTMCASSVQGIVKCVNSLSIKFYCSITVALTMLQQIICTLLQAKLLIHIGPTVMVY